MNYKDSFYTAWRYRIMQYNSLSVVKLEVIKIGMLFVITQVDKFHYYNEPYVSFWFKLFSDFR